MLITAGVVCAFGESMAASDPLSELNAVAKNNRLPYLAVTRGTLQNKAFRMHQRRTTLWSRLLCQHSSSRRNVRRTMCETANPANFVH